MSVEIESATRLPGNPATAVDAPLVVVGGGAGGLSTSIFLSTLGVDHLLIGAPVQPDRAPGEVALGLPTMEVFRQFGLDESLMLVATAIDGVPCQTSPGSESRDQGDTGVVMFPPRRTDSPTCPAHLQARSLADVLTTHAHHRGAGRLRLGDQVWNIRPYRDGVVAEVRAGGEDDTTYEVRSRYAVFADGAGDDVTLGTGSYGRLLRVGSRGGWGRRRVVESGVRDSHALAWRLALVLTGRAGTTMLERFENERRADDAAFRPLRGGGAPAVGARVPHAWLARVDQRLSTHDLVGIGHFALLIGSAGAQWAQAAQYVSRALGVRVNAVSVGANGYRDIDGKWNELRLISDGGAVLLRPDNRIAYISRYLPADPARTLETALRATLCR